MGGADGVLLWHDVKVLATMTQPAGDVTTWLDAWRRGEEGALVRLMEVVQDELHGMARGLFRGERRGHTLQPTAMVNEVYLRLERQHRITLRSRTEFFAVAARLMRRVLVDHARRHGAAKRGGDAVRVELEDAHLPEGLLHGGRAPEVLALDLALLDLERRSPRQSRIVEMRVLVGLTLEEIASVEGISLSTVSRDWKAARLFLLRQLRPA
ncbi:MAG: ECF-type sigma factor [Acidobacteriota bacterium]